MNVVGYKLIKIETGDAINQWGGVWGQCPGVPNPITLPNGDHICAPEVDVEYSGYKLTLWEMEPPPPSVPASVPLWAVRVILANQNLLDDANAAVIASNNIAIKTIWEYGNFVDRDSPALLVLATALGIEAQLDDLFIAANNLKV